VVNGNGTNGFLASLKRWGPIGAVLFALGAWSATIQSDLNHKASAEALSAITYTIQNQLTQIQNQLADIQARQRQMSCAGKPDYCR